MYLTLTISQNFEPEMHQCKKAIEFAKWIEIKYQH